MNLQGELGAQQQAIREKKPRHVAPTVRAATQRLRDAGLAPETVIEWIDKHSTQ